MLQPKFKVCAQTKKNIWKTSKIYKNFKSSKWAFINIKKKKAYKHYSLRQNDVFLSKFSLLKEIPSFKDNKYRRKIKAFFSFRRYQRNFYYFNSKFKLKRKYYLKNFSFFHFYFKNYKNQKFFNKRYLYKNFYRINLNNFRISRKLLGKVTLKQFKKISYSLFGFKPLYSSDKNLNFIYHKRFDFFLNNLQIGLSIFHIRNLINFGFFFVNNTVIKSPNYLLKKGDIITYNFNKSSHIFKQILWRIFKKPLYYRKNLSNCTAEINWNTLSVFVL